MKINQSLLAKVGWGITGYGLCNIVKNLFLRYELRDEYLELAEPEDIANIYKLFDNAVCNFIVLWATVIVAGILIAIILHKMLSLYAGVCAGIATLCCKFLGPISLYFVNEYFRETWIFTPQSTFRITATCSIIAVIAITALLYAGSYLYDCAT